MLTHNDESDYVIIHISKETKNVNEDKQLFNAPLDLTVEDEDEPSKVIWHSVPLGDPETVKIIEQKEKEPLTFISTCSEEKIKSLEKKYQMSRKLLDAILKENRGKYLKNANSFYFPFSLLCQHMPNHML